MNAFFKHLWVQFKMDIRERGTLMTYYLIPLVFYFVILHSREIIPSKPL